MTYLLYTLIIILVLGPQKWSLYHYAGLVGAPVVIYSVRTLIAAFFDWRISRQQSYLEGLQKQRESKIADLKKATKYDSTQELLAKYGAAPPPSKTPSKQPQQGPKRKANNNDKPPQRTGIAPPPTANIPGRNVSSPPLMRPNVDTNSPPPSAHGRSPLSASMLLNQSPTSITPDAPGFAPNAFADMPQAPPSNTAYDSNSTPHWYDRILDVLLGEDETAAKNRLVLLCSNCRLVNGQAPPGVRTLEELGRWRCSGCGAWNGAESEGAKVVKEITGAAIPASPSKQHHDGEGWEKVPRSAEEDIQEEDDLHPDVSKEEENFAAGTTSPISPTGRDGGDESGLSKRVTRSARKKSSSESLE